MEALKTSMQKHKKWYQSVGDNLNQAQSQCLGMKRLSGLLEIQCCISMYALQ